MTQDEFYEWMERLSQLTDKLAPAIDEQKEINKNLQALLAKHDARLDQHEMTFVRIGDTMTKLDTTLDNILGYIQGQGRYGQN